MDGWIMYGRMDGCDIQWVLRGCDSHSFIPDIPIAPLQTTTTLRRSRLQHGYCGVVNTPMIYMQLRVKDLPKVPTWQLEWDSNPRPSGRNAPNLPLIHHAPRRRQIRTSRQIPWKIVELVDGWIDGRMDGLLGGCLLSG